MVPSERLYHKVIKDEFSLDCEKHYPTPSESSCLFKINKKNWRVNDHIVKGLFFHKISLPVWNTFILIWCTTARCLHFLASFGQFFNKVQKTTQHKIKQSKSSCIFLKISKFNPQTSKMWFEILPLDLFTVPSNNIPLLIYLSFWLPFVW